MVPSMGDLFGGAAPYYARYRPRHAASAIEHLAMTFGAGSTVLDLGCGPGTVAVPLARRVREVLAVDPDAEMLAEGERLAAGAPNIRWIRGDSTGLRELPPFDHVVMGRSFHWMDRRAVLAGSPFSVLDVAHYEERLTYGLEEVVGLQLSYSYTSPDRLGARLADFTEAVRRELLAVNPRGTWELTVITQVLTAVRPPRPARTTRPRG